MHTDYDELPLKQNLENLVGVNSSTYTYRGLCSRPAWNRSLPC